MRDRAKKKKKKISIDNIKYSNKTKKILFFFLCNIISIDFVMINVYNN